ncbi:MAG TPA: HAMP domain-containing sensor histidine kinase, partial [Chloroflexota bacterium]|nr:HAMP domain-containing sensor histidine kinase [Chloroflexota bacterium]
PEVYQRVSRDPEHLRLLEVLEIRSAMLVPLISGERVLGTMSLIAAESGRQFTPDDLALAKELARRCALAVDNALHYRRAKEAIAVRDEFLSIAAHELKTPITTLSGFAQVLLRRMQMAGNVDPERLRHGLDTIHLQAQRLTQLVNQLLDISRLESGRLTLDWSEVDLISVVRGVTDAIQQTTERHRIAVEAPPSLVALADPLRLEQVLTNLITNAVKFCPNGGDVVVSLTANAPPSASDPDATSTATDHTQSAIRIAVRDHGLGIPEAERTRIFDRWYQVQRDGHLSSGLGLGLYISKQIVELHGGSIAATSPEGGGTCVTVTLPIAAAVPA